jgi:hypothetical protein
MAGEMVMRSITLTRDEDQAMREIAHKAGVNVGEVIRAAVAGRIADWEANNSDALLNSDLKAIGRGNTGR